MRILVIMVAITLIACTITGARADLSYDKAADAALNLLTLINSASKNRLSTIPLSNIKKELNLTSALTDENPKGVNVEALLNTVFNFAKLVYAPMTPDSSKTPLPQVQKELEHLRLTLSLHTGVVNKQISSFTEEVKSALVSSSLERQVHLERSILALNAMLKNIALDLDSKTMEKLGSFVSLAPYSQSLQVLITEVLDELINNLQSNAQKMCDKIDQRALTLYEGLSPLAADMQDVLRRQMESVTYLIKKNVNEVGGKILDDATQLKKALGFFANLFKEEDNLELRYAKKTLDLCVIKINEKVVAFRDVVSGYQDLLNQALLKQVADLNENLVEGAASGLENMKNLERSLLDKILMMTIT